MKSGVWEQTKDGQLSGATDVDLAVEDCRDAEFHGAPGHIPLALLIAGIQKPAQVACVVSSKNGRFLRIVGTHLQCPQDAADKARRMS
jgi:hypothetical protein